MRRRRPDQLGRDLEDTGCCASCPSLSPRESDEPAGPRGAKRREEGPGLRWTKAERMAEDGDAVPARPRHRPPGRAHPGKGVADGEGRRVRRAITGRGGLLAHTAGRRASVTRRAPQTPRTERLGQRSGWSPRSCISSKFPGDAVAAGRGPPPGASLQKSQSLGESPRCHPWNRSPGPAASARPCEAQLGAKLSPHRCESEEHFTAGASGNRAVTSSWGHL